MENISTPPNYKDSKKYFLLSNHDGTSLPFTRLSPSILTPSGRNLLVEFEESAGKFLGGGVFKSSQLEAKAKEVQVCLATYNQMRAYISSLPAREVIVRSPEWTSEWIALEYALLLSVTMYGMIIPIKWDQLESLNVKRKNFISSDSIMEINYVTSSGKQDKAVIQANSLGMNSLLSIAKACGVS